MIKRYRRCTHCNVRYLYQESGAGCHEELNDSRYCADCMQIVIDALNKVPKKREKDYRTIPKEVWENRSDDLVKAIKAKKEESKGKMRRVYFPLFETSTGRSIPAESIEDIIEGSKGELIIHYYADTFEINQVRKPVEINCITGEEIGPWRD